MPELLTRYANVSASTFRREGEVAKVDAVITTGAAYRRKGYVETLSVLPGQVALPDTAPLRDSHRATSIRDILGRATAFKFEPGQIVATLEIHDPQAAALVESGQIGAVSIGYRVTAYEDCRVGGEIHRRQTHWQLAEVSLTDNPADPAARIRSDEMPKDLQTEDREALIQRVRAAHNLPEEWATRMTEAGEELTDDELRVDARDCALAARLARKPAQIRTNAPANDDPQVILTRQADALAARMTGATPDDAARPFMQMGLQDLARDALARSGVSVAAMGREEILSRAMHGTSDFPQLLTASGNRVLSTAYQRAESPLKLLARQRTAPDFRALSTLKVGEFGPLAEVTEHGEVTATTTAEAVESYGLKTFARTFALSRKAIINDDLGAFGRWAEMMGQAAAETEALQLLGLLTANAGAGTTMTDGKALFHADHGNITSETDMSQGLMNARIKMRQQKGLGGAVPVAVTPKYLLVGPEMETVAEGHLAPIWPAEIAQVNPMAGRLTLLVDPHITGERWYLFADPSTGPVLEYAYLSSAPGPQLSSRDGWEVLGREFRVVLDFGCGATDHRGAVRNG